MKSGCVAGRAQLVCDRGLVKTDEARRGEARTMENGVMRGDTACALSVLKYMDYFITRSSGISIDSSDDE